MQDLKKFIKSTGVYLVGNVSVRMISFLLLPLYTAYINPSDYGTYDLNLAYINFLMSILFLDIWGGIMRFMFDYEKDNDKAYPVKAGIVIFTISTVIYTIAVIVMGRLLNLEYIFWLFLFGLLTNLQNVFGFVARGYQKSKLFAASGIVSAFVTVMCNIIFIVGLHKGYQYLYISSCIGALAGILIIANSIKIFSLLKYCRLDMSLLKAMAVYSLPLSVNSAAYWFLSSFNKVLINYKLSTVDNGLYAVANKFSSIINVFTYCFQMAWQELTFSKAGTNREEMSKFYTKAFHEYIKFMTLGCTGIIACVKIIFPIMVNSSYYEASNLAPFAILTALFSCLSSFLGSIISTLKRNRFIFTTTLTGSLTNVIVAILLMDYLGVQAANISLMVGYIVIDIRRFVLIKQFIDIKISKRSMIMLALQVVVVCWVYMKFDAVYSGIVVIALCFEAVIIYKKRIKELLNRSKV